jgi:hypothetical protein
MNSAVVQVTGDTGSALIALAALGWGTALVLAIALLLVHRPFRLALRDEQLMVFPSSIADDVAAALPRLEGGIATTTRRLGEHSSSVATQLRDVSAAVRAASEVQAVLRDDIASKASEIRQLRLSHEYHARQPVLRRIAHAIAAMDADTRTGVDPATTLAGVRVELEECLEDNHVRTQWPTVGSRLTEVLGIDPRQTVRTSTPNDELRGTVAEAMRPVYVVRGPNGHEEPLLPAIVKVYV